MDKLRSDLKEHQVDPKLAQRREDLKKAIITIDPGREAPRTGIRSACLCNDMFMSTQERSHFNGCALVKKMLQKLPCINRMLKELEVFRTEYVKKSIMHDVITADVRYFCKM